MRSERVDAADATAACARMTQQASRESVWLGLNTHQPPIDNDSSTRPAEHTTPHSTPLCISLLAGPTDQTRQSLNRVTPAGRSIIATLCTDMSRASAGLAWPTRAVFVFSPKSLQANSRTQSARPACPNRTSERTIRRPINKRATPINQNGGHVGFIHCIHIAI